MPLSRISTSSSREQSTVPGKVRRRQKFSNKREFEQAVEKMKKKLDALPGHVDYHLVLTTEAPRESETT